MPSSKLALASGLAAIVLCGCGSALNPPRGRGRIEDNRVYPKNHIKCLRQDHFAVQKIGATGIQIGQPPAGPTISFQPTPGSAQAQQLEGVRSAQGAEVIGPAQLYPNQASDSQLKQIELCLSQGVGG
jgi:hypothetical protein